MTTIQPVLKADPYHLLMRVLAAASNVIELLEANA